MAKSKTDLAEYLIARNSALKNEQATWLTLWQEIGDYVMPRKAEILTKQSSPGSQRNSVIFDSTAIYSNAVLANGMLSHMTPADSRWFVFDPPRNLADNDDAKQWFQACTEAAQIVLATSNFYSAIHELFFDDGAFGTSVLYVQEGRQAPLNFKTFDIGTYCISENSEGYVDTIFKEVEFTCRQAEEEFGEDNLSDKLRKELQEAKTKGNYPDRKHSFLHAIYPRPETERKAGKTDGPNKPIASVYVEVAAKHVCRNSGYDELPFFASRHLKWGSCVYGWSPSWVALPEARQLNFLTKQLDYLAEVKAFPRMLVPDTHEGEIDLRAGGQTYFDPNQPAAMPKEWMTQGDYAIGLEREQRKRDAIERAYHVDLFRMFSGIDKQMTAREVSERAGEKLIQFTPAFARKTTELLNPMLRRVFAICIKKGLFPPPPAAVLERDAEGNLFVPEPDITYTSRIALAVKALSNVSFMRSMELISPIAQVKPEILDNFNFDQITRDGARNDGLPADWLMDQKKVDEMRQARAQAQAQAQQQQQMLMAAEAAQKAGSIKKDSALAEALTQQQ